MTSRQGPPLPQLLSLHTERLGPLPLINHFLARLGLDALLQRFVPTDDPRARLPFAHGLGVLLRSVLVEREPIYRQQETVATFAPQAFQPHLRVVPSDAVVIGLPEGCTYPGWRDSRCSRGSAAEPRLWASPCR